LDLVCAYANPSDPTQPQITLATPEALAKVLLPSGFALEAASAESEVNYAGPGSMLPLGLPTPPSGLPTPVVLGPTGPNLQLAPRSGDTVLGLAETSRGSVLVQPHLHHGELHLADFGADPNGVVSIRGPLQLAIQTAVTDVITGDGPMVRTLTLGQGGYFYTDRPLLIQQGNLWLRGQGRTSTFLTSRGTQAAPYVGPLLVPVAADAQPFTRHENDFDGGYTADIDGRNFINLCRYGEAWSLNGLNAFCIEWIAKFTEDNENDSPTLFSLAGTTNDSVGITTEQIDVTFLGEGFGHTGSQLAPRIRMTTTNGTAYADSPTGDILTDGSDHDLALDYDGSILRFFVRGELKVQVACSGSVVHWWYQTVCLGWGVPSGHDGINFCTNAPKGMRLASMRLSHVSRYSENYTPHTSKFEEDADTQFLINFDEVDGPLMKARSRTVEFGMLDAWLPNLYGSGNQIGPIHITDMYLANGFGPAIDAIASPNLSVRDVTARSQSGAILSANCYVSEFIRIKFLGNDRLRGTGIHSGPACNYVHYEDTDIGGFDTGYVLSAQSHFTGHNYVKHCAYANYVLDPNSFNNVIAGMTLLSDEDNTVPCKYGLIALGWGNLTLIGVLFGDNKFTSGERSVWLSKAQRPISYDGKCKVTFDSCVFSEQPSNASPHVLVSDMDEGDNVLFRNCTFQNPILERGSNGNANVRVEEWEYGAEFEINGGDMDVTLKQDDWLHGHLAFVGAQTEARTFTTPNVPGYRRVIRNGRTGGFDILLQAENSSVVLSIPPGSQKTVYCMKSGDLRFEA